MRVPGADVGTGVAGVVVAGAGARGRPAVGPHATGASGSGPVAAGAIMLAGEQMGVAGLPFLGEMLHELA